MSLQIELLKLLAGYLLTLVVSSLVQDRLHLESAPSLGASDEVYHGRVAHQWLSLPVHADK